MVSIQAPSTRKTIIADLDGSVADYDGAIGRLFGADMAALRANAGADAPFTSHGLLGLGFQDVVNAIHGNDSGALAAKRMADFWESIEPYPGAIDFLHRLRELAPLSFVTQPFALPGVKEGKGAWLRRHGLGDLAVEFSDPETGKRDHLASPDTILVDDNDMHLAAFDRAGGHAVCVPQPWNHMRAATALSQKMRYALVVAKIQTVL